LQLTRPAQTQQHGLKTCLHSVVQDDTRGSISDWRLLEVRPHNNGRLNHMVGVNDLPEAQIPSIKCHAIPIEVLHTNPEVGEAISDWAHKLLSEGRIKFANVELDDGGMGAIKSALEHLSKGKPSAEACLI